jgi:pimeloyl-ACP methyl ester carboxylesterase
MPFSDLPTGARLFYEDVGQGTPVILLHGMFGTARHHLTADYRESDIVSA